MHNTMAHPTLCTGCFCLWSTEPGRVNSEVLERGGKSKDCLAKNGKSMAKSGSQVFFLGPGMEPLVTPRCGGLRQSPSWPLSGGLNQGPGGFVGGSGEHTATAVLPNFPPALFHNCWMPHLLMHHEQTSHLGIIERN